MKEKIKFIKRYAFFFTIGGTGYAIIELIWRGRTHWTMLIAGGICFIIFSVIEEKLKKRSAILKAVISSSLITAVELMLGLIFNVVLKMHVWDYSKQRFNILGQICPLYSCLWVVLSALVMPLASRLNAVLC